MMGNKLTQREIINLKKYSYRELSRSELKSLARNIYLSIEEELKASAYYQTLADIAPDPFAGEMLLEFSRDERKHAYELQQAYEVLSDRKYMPPGEMEYKFEVNNYLEALEERILGETADFRKYKEYYLMTSNPILRDIFFNAMHDEAYHAIREMYLIHMEMMRRMMMENKQDDIMNDMREMMGNMMNMMENMMNMMCEMSPIEIQKKGNGSKEKE